MASDAEVPVHEQLYVLLVWPQQGLYPQHDYLPLHPYVVLLLPARQSDFVPILPEPQHDVWKPIRGEDCPIIDGHGKHVRLLTAMVEQGDVQTLPWERCHLEGPNLLLDLQ